MGRGLRFLWGVVMLVGLGLLGHGAQPIIRQPNMLVPASSFCECTCTIPGDKLVLIGRFDSAGIAYQHAVETPDGLASSTDPTAPRGWRECSGPLYEDADGQTCRVVELLTLLLVY